MSITVEVPDVGEVEFPDGMSNDDIQSAIKSHLGGQSAPAAPKESPFIPQVIRSETFGEKIRSSPLVTAILGQEGTPRDPLTGEATGLVPALFSSSKPAMDRIEHPKTISEGIHNIAANVVDSVASPGGFALTATGAELPLILKRVIGGAFATQGAVGLIKDPIKGKTAGETVENLGNKALDVLMVAGGAHAIKPSARTIPGVPDAIRDTQAAEVHGDLRAQPEQGPGQVPVQEGGPGVQPQAEAVAKPSQIPLTKDDVHKVAGVLTDYLNSQGKDVPPETLKQINSVIDQIKERQQAQPAPKSETPLMAPEDQRYLDEERKSIDSPVEVVKEIPKGHPFAGQIATIDRSSGKVMVNPNEFSKWIKGIPEENRPQAVRSLLSEEQIHLAVPDSAAEAYHNTLTGAEKLINRRRYTGQWGRRLNDTEMGHEALRFRMQQLARMTPREIAEASGREKWTVQGLTAVESAIRGAREALGTKASKEGNAILGRMQQNLDAAKVAAGMSPAAISKTRTSEAKEEAERLGVTFKPVSAFDASTIPEDIRQKHPDTVAELERLQREKGWEFTDPKTGMTFYTAVDAPVESIRSRHEEVISGGVSKRNQPNYQAIQALPERPPGTIRLFNGSAGGSGISWSWWTDSPQKAASFGENVQYVDVPMKQAFDGKAAAKKRGQGGSTYFIDDPIVRTAKPVGKLEPPVHDLDTGPGARRKKYESMAQEKMFLPPILKEHVEERASATEMGAVRADPVTPQKVTTDAQTHLSEASRPNFNDFVDELKSKYGNEVKPGQVKEVWGDAVWNHLMGAGGEDLGRLAQRLGLVKALKLDALGGELKRISDKLPEPTAEQPEPTPEQLQSQKRRNRVIAGIGSKLIQESEENKRSWTRKEVTPDDIGLWRSTSEGAWRPILADESKDPATIGRILTEGAGTERSTVSRSVRGGEVIESRRKAPPESVTKRLVALRENATGKVRLVSAYRGSQGPMIVDPAEIHLKRPNVPINSFLLKRYQPLYSMLLDEPVQNFHQSFDSVKDFEDRFASEARARAQDYAQREEEAARTGAGVIEPGEETPGAFSAGRPLTDAEMGATLDHIISDVGEFKSGDDALLALDSLRIEAKEKPITQQKTNVIAAWQKMFRSISARNPDLSVEDTLRKLGNELYEIHDQAKSYEEFVQRAVERYSRMAPESPPKSLAELAAPTGPESSARELTMRERRAPTEVEGAKPGTGPTKESDKIPPRGPAAMRKVKESIEEEAAQEKRKAGAMFTRGGTKEQITALRDGADNTANNYARASANSIRIESKDPMVRAAAKAVIATGDDPTSLTDMLAKTDQGIEKATALMNDRRGSATDRILNRRVGKSWLKAAQKLKSELEYARDHWDSDELQNTAEAVKRELSDEFDYETKNGINLKEEPNYIPGRYDAEFFNDDSVMFGEQRILGRNFRKPKSFKNYYDAIAAGPYVPKTYDAADLVEHRVRQGRREVNKDMWLEGLKNMIDPHSDMPVVTAAQERGGRMVPPTPEHELFSLGINKKPVAVRVGYRDLLDVLTMQSSVEKSPVGKFALAATGLAKHGVILIMDTFHPGRLGQLALAVMGREAGYKRGLTALEYRPQDIPRAIEAGELTPEQAAWAHSNIEVHLPEGRTATTTRYKILQDAQRVGLNVGRLQDALYADLVKRVPVIGTMNKWVFDKFTRGLMSEMVVREFERLNKDHPEVDSRKLLRDIVKDSNIYFGSLGRQGWIKNPTFRDALQLVGLAPQWTEGLIQKEARFAGRLAMAPIRMARGEIAMGTLGRGMARGLAAYVVLTQVINLITRRQLTFQNEEEGHKLDAWIPTGENTGFWLSPLSVFGEITHDVLRLSETKPTVARAIRQIGENKLGPWGRMAMVLATQESPTGEKLTSTASVIGTALKQLIPTPISLGTPARAIGHAIAPGMISPPPPGAVERQLLSSAGIKVQPGNTATQQIISKANRFMEEEGLPKQDPPAPTDEPSYAKLRQAVRNGDVKSASMMYEAMQKTHSDLEIKKAMKEWTRRPFTGSKRAERNFMSSLTDPEMELYNRAQEERQKVYEDFLELANSR